MRNNIFGLKLLYSIIYSIDTIGKEEARRQCKAITKARHASNLVMHRELPSHAVKNGSWNIGTLKVPAIKIWKPLK
jgi:hypothetical protein